MKAPPARRQKTIKVGDETIKMVARRVTRAANHCGYRVNVNGVDWFYGVLTVQEAFDLAFVNYVETTKTDGPQASESAGDGVN